MTNLTRILHIDDDAVMRMMVKKSLERSFKEFEIISCGTPVEFMDHLSRFEPDLLIIDINMPLLSGPDLLKKIRDLPCHCPALFMTGEETTNFIERDHLDPIIGVIQKPFSPLTLGNDLLNLWKTYQESTDSGQQT